MYSSEADARVVRDALAVDPEVGARSFKTGGQMCHCHANACSAAPLAPMAAITLRRIPDCEVDSMFDAVAAQTGHAGIDSGWEHTTHVRTQSLLSYIAFLVGVVFAECARILCGRIAAGDEYVLTQRTFCCAQILFSSGRPDTSSSSGDLL